MYCVLDIETDGVGTFRPPKQRPIQLSYEILDNDFNIVKTYNSYINGVDRIEYGDKTVEFINDNGKNKEEVFERLLSDISMDTIMVGHNVEFDLGCLENMMGYIFSNEKIDTMKISTDICKMPPFKYGKYKFPKLEELANFLKIEINKSRLHDSEYDVYVTRECFKDLKKKYNV